MNHNRNWTFEETRAVQDAREKGHSLREIAQQLGRSTSSIAGAIYRMRKDGRTVATVEPSAQYVAVPANERRVCFRCGNTSMNPCKHLERLAA